MISRPYIGITDIASRAQAEALLEVVTSTYSPFWAPRLGVGVMCSYKTLNGIDTRWAKVWPKTEDIGKIFTIDKRDAFNILHYADYDGHPLVENLNKALSLIEEPDDAGDVDAVQLDMVWPNPHEVLEFRCLNPQTEVILQVNEKAIERCSGNLERVAAFVSMYENTVDTVLLDMSMGRGKELDSRPLQLLMEAIAAQRPEMAFAVAGGLGPDTLGNADDLYAVDSLLSIDAQSKLRPSGSAMDPLSDELCAQYLVGAAKRYGKILRDHR